MVAATKAVWPALAVGPQWVGLSRSSEAGLMTALFCGRRRSGSPQRTAESGGNASFPIWPAGEVHSSRALINGLKSRHQTQRLFQFCRW
jgi:hypothetical protein